MAEDLNYSTLKYGTENYLQELGIWDIPESQRENTNEIAYWFVYIHGGAWCDPRQTRTDAQPGITKILEELPRERIAGFASLDYRLSPHPGFPQDPATTPSEQLRAARHPDHVRDVRGALAALCRTRRIGGGGRTGRPYVLYGHSCGATLALQVLMGRDLVRREGDDEEEDEVPLPVAIVGFEGIYDLRGLNERFRDEYRGFMAAAFGPHEAAWDAASPAKFDERRFRKNWGAMAEKRVVVLAHSPQDELVDMEELEAMEKVLREGELNVLAFKDLKGTHDEIWKDGRYIASVLSETIKKLDRLEELSVP